MLMPAEPSDREGIETLAREVHALHVNWRPDIYTMPQALYPEERFREALAEKALYVAKQDGAVVGYAAVKIRDFDWAGMVKRKILFVDEFAVSSHRRRQGIGREMMAQLNVLAAQWGCDGLQLSVYPQNREALEFYESCGFSMQSVTMSKKI